MHKPTDLTQDWPPDPENADLERLAESLASAVPALPAEALARVQTRVQAELERGERRQRLSRVIFGWSMAAAILLSLSTYIYWRGTLAPADPPRLPDIAFEHAPEPIADRVIVAVGDTTPAPADAKPLVRLDDHRSLFSD